MKPSSDGETIILCNIYSTADGTLLKQFNIGKVEKASYSNDGNTLLCCFSDTTSIWSLDGTLINTLNLGMNNLSSIDIDNRRKFVVGTSFEFYAKIWSAVDSTLLKTFSTEPNYEIVFTPNSNIISFGESNFIKIWSIHCKAMIPASQHFV